jgi:hypothetical protein
MPSGAYPGIHAAFPADRPGSAPPHPESRVHGLRTTTGGGAGRVHLASPDGPGGRRTAIVVTGCTEAPCGAVPSVAVVTRCTRHEDGGRRAPWKGPPLHAAGPPLHAPGQTQRPRADAAPPDATRAALPERARGTWRTTRRARPARP